MQKLDDLPERFMGRAAWTGRDMQERSEEWIRVTWPEAGSMTPIPSRPGRVQSRRPSGSAETS